MFSRVILKPRSLKPLVNVLKPKAVPVKKISSTPDGPIKPPQQEGADTIKKAMNGISNEVLAVTFGLFLVAWTYTSFQFLHSYEVAEVN